MTVKPNIDKLAVIPIVIVQTSQFGLMACEISLQEAGFIEGRDYILNDEADEIAEFDIVPGKRQLLVTGTVHGDKSEADEFVRRMKVKNPKLEAAFFSVFSFGCPNDSILPYDSIIDKSFGGNLTKNLIKKVREFLEKEKE